ncbi:8-amino-7-oxononanoate synthase [Geobacter sulfurreducens]|uniref:8-amino-7-oxononanoate synthase n=1 Tax=Geobacter sulfurreducens TaxID=35554 RepID=UPI0020B678B1|nr:8-amino-7-oxononanoate synthase [Geobacter sulfurreducens]UTG91970.1 8-amino-7-oxononanoate synthase [Geobacter sulfurreducens]
MTRSIAGELQQLREQGLYRSLRTVAGSQGSRVVAEGREVVLLCSNNYLGLADHPSLKRAAVEAVERYGTGSGASRLVSGTMELHAALEERLARFKGTDAALVFNSGYAANSGIIPALVGRGDVVFSDRLNHASIVDGCLLSRARFVRYPHNDMNALERLLAEHRGAGRMLIVTDGVFSMDGDLAPLPALVALKRQYGALLMVDDAHGTGVLGESGRGSAEQFEVAADIDLQMGTLGKALGGFGAYVAASAEVVELLINRARSFIFSTSLPPAVLAAARAALDLVDSPEGKALRRRLARSAALFRDALQEAGFDTMGSETQIVPALVGEAEPAMTFTRRLLEEGFYVQGIRPPTVPAGTCRLRCTLMATHDESDLERAVAAMARIGKELGIV